MVHGISLVCGLPKSYQKMTHTWIVIVSSPEPKAHKVSLYDGTRADICPSVRLFTISNMNISETSGPIAIKFYLKHYRDGGILHYTLGNKVELGKNQAQKDQ